MGKAKIVFFGRTLWDALGADIVAGDILRGKKGWDKNGDLLTGTCDFDADTSDADATAAEILYPKSAYVAGAKVPGTMPNNGGTDVELSDLTDAAIPMGFHDGSGKAKIADTEKAKIIPENIRQGVFVLGVEGSMSGSEDVVAQAKTVVPSDVAQTLLPDPGYTHLSQVTVAAVPYAETTTPTGGTVITIG